MFRVVMNLLMQGPAFFLLHQVMDRVESRRENGRNVVILWKEADSDGEDAD